MIRSAVEKRIRADQERSNPSLSTNSKRFLNCIFSVDGQELDLAPKLTGCLLHRLELNLDIGKGRIN